RARAHALPICNPVTRDTSAPSPPASYPGAFPHPSSGPPAYLGHEEEGTTSEGRSSQGETVPPRRPERPPRGPPTRGRETPVKRHGRDFIFRLGFDLAQNVSGTRMLFDYDFQMRIGALRPTVFERLLRIEH